MNWMPWLLFWALLGISAGCNQNKSKEKKDKELKECLKKEKCTFVVPDKFDGVLKKTGYLNRTTNGCIIFLEKDATRRPAGNKRLQMNTTDGDVLYISKRHLGKKVPLCVLQGEQCNTTDLDSECHAHTVKGSKKQGTGATTNGNDEGSKNTCLEHSTVGHCHVTCLCINDICGGATYSESNCNTMAPGVKNKYIINITAPNTSCLNCDNPVKKPQELDPEVLKNFSVTVDTGPGGEVKPAQAVQVMNTMSELAASIDVASAALTLGEGVTGVLVRETDPEDINEVSFAYVSPNDSINAVVDQHLLFCEVKLLVLPKESGGFGESDLTSVSRWKELSDIKIVSPVSLASFQRSVTVPKEAFKEAINMNVSVPFAAVFRFLNMGKDEKNSTVLGNEVLAIEMGARISNLTDQISINFLEMKYEGIPSCQSWNGEGKQPNWTDDGCQTTTDGDNITCQCSHLTFFAILLAPPNVTISSSDLSNLTTITQVGCGLSMFFLSIVLFMHFLLRKTKASKATRILIHLVAAMFMLNLTFLINNFVAKMKNSVGCMIMAAAMHYFMLATFTWFAVQALHLCLQLHMGGKIVIRRYLLKVSITSWVLPGVVGIILLATGKYGEQTIYTDDTYETTAICWIMDPDVHYIVNIGYYALVFIFTFTTFIIIMSWLFCLKRTSAGNAQVSRNGKSIVTILGLCCLLGITWGFAFFAQGVLRIPGYYIFTVLNSFQGFFLFIYYYNTSHSGEITGGDDGRKNLTSSSSTSTSTLKTSLDTFNPYDNVQGGK